MAICVSKGRLALFTDNRTKVRLAKEAQEAAHTALTCDPGSDIAHHLNGRWHYEMAQVGLGWGSSSGREGVRAGSGRSSTQRTGPQVVLFCGVWVGGWGVRL